MKGLLFAILFVCVVLFVGNAVISGDVALVEPTPSSEWNTDAAHVSGPSQAFGDLAEAVMSFGR